MENTLIIKDKDLMIMKLSHYFITEKNYNPIILHGINDEIWLENLDEDYRVIRIVGHYIHNNEQMNFDKFKLNRIIRQIKKKTFTLNMNVLSIYVDIGDNVSSKEETDEHYKSIFVKKIKDLKNPELLEFFPDIIEKTKFDEKGIDLFARITNDINNTNISKGERLAKIFTNKSSFVTYTIIIICVILFGLMYILGNGSMDENTLIAFGANLGSFTKSGEYFRLITCAFLHIGVVHLLFNMYALYVLGPQVESFFGKFKFTLIYLLSAVSASILSLIFNDNVISAGASGAIFGLLGALLYFGYYYRVYLGNVLKSQIVPIVLINLLFGFVVQGVDNAAHIGGLIGGILTSMALGAPDKKNKTDRINGFIVLTIYFGFIIYMAFFMK